MTTTQIMTEEATAARNLLASEIRSLIETGTTGATLNDKIDALRYYNRMLQGLGAIPSGMPA